MRLRTVSGRQIGIIHP